MPTDLKYPSAIPSLEIHHQGKTRDLYPTLSQDHLLFVATDRVSTHDVVHLSKIPNKGYVLNALSIFWFELLGKRGIPHHMAACGMKIYDFLPGDRRDYPLDLHLRAMVVKRLSMTPIEFILRNYLAGSLWSKFYSKGIPNPYGHDLPSGLKLMHRFSEPLETPTEKSKTDDPRNAKEVREKYPEETELFLKAFNIISAYLQNLGLAMIDSKGELGRDKAWRLCLGDEAFTFDSSRITKLKDVKEGEMPPWLDKQPARDEAERIWASGKSPLEFSAEVVKKIETIYLDTAKLILGTSLGRFQHTRLD